MEWLIGGGPIMIPLLICSILSLAVIIERAINLRRDKILRPEIIQTIEALRSQEDIPFAISKCEVIPGPFSNLLRRTLMNNHLSREEKFIDIQAAGRQETKALEKRLLVLEVITAVAPFIRTAGDGIGTGRYLWNYIRTGAGSGQGLFRRACRSYQNHGVWALYCNSKLGCV